MYLSELPDINFREVFPKLEKLKLRNYTENLEVEYPTLKKLIINDIKSPTRDHIEKLVKGKTPGFYLKCLSKLTVTEEEIITVAKNNRHAIIDVWY